MITPLLQTTLDFTQAAKEQELAGAATTFPELISGLLSGIMAMAALLVLLYLVWAGVEWITAGGDSSKIEKARTKIMQSIIGIIVLSAALAFFMLLQSFLGLELLGIGSSSRTGATLDQGKSSSNSLRDALEGASGGSSDSSRNALLEAFRDRSGSANESDSVLDTRALPDELPEGDKE